MTFLLAALAALAALLFGGKGQTAEAPTEPPARRVAFEARPVVVRPIARGSSAAGATCDERLVLDVIVDADRLDRPLSAAEMRQRLLSAAKVLSVRLPNVSLTHGVDPTTGRPFLRIQAREDSGLTRDRLVWRATCSGEFGLEGLALDRDLAELGTSLVSERERLDDWREEHPDAPLSAFEHVDPEDGGPHASLRWCWMRGPDGTREPAALLREARADLTFGLDDIETLAKTQDTRGFPALQFDVLKSRRSALAAFTLKFLDRQVAVRVGDAVLMAPVLNDTLHRGAVITGGAEGFSVEEIDDIVAVLSYPLEDIPLALANG